MYKIKKYMDDLQSVIWDKNQKERWGYEDIKRRQIIY